MNIWPSPIEAVAIVLSIGFPLLLMGYAHVAGLRRAGVRFRIASLTGTAIFVASCILLPGPFDVSDALAAGLLLATAILFWWTFWSLLAWGFTP